MEQCSNPDNCRNAANHLKCSVCQNQIRRAVKRGRNRYRAHGPCQTDATRTWRRNARWQQEQAA